MTRRWWVRKGMLMGEQSIHRDMSDVEVADAADYDRLAPLEWTKEKPTEPGWYWWRDSRGGEAAVLIMADPDNVLWAKGGFWKEAHRIDGLGGEWSNRPIAIPHGRSEYE